MRKRHIATPRLESMEDRVVPSFLGINVPSWVTTDWHKMGRVGVAGARVVSGHHGIPAARSALPDAVRPTCTSIQ